MKILILDDQQSRHQAYADWYAGEDVRHAYTLSQFEEFLADSPYDLISLDHDICDYGLSPEGPFGHREQRELTGRDAATLVVRLPLDRRPGQVIVHTGQPNGAVILADLKNAGILSVWIPFKVE